MKIIKLSIITLAIAVFVLQAANIFIANKTASSSFEATKVKEKIEAIRESNEELTQKILVHASYNSIASRAAELGYANSKDFISLYDPVQVAIGR